MSTVVQLSPPALTLRPLTTNVSFRDQAYAALKQAIMAADIYAHPEEIRLDERELSRALGVSRTPVREAVTVLEQEGFLRNEPRRGVFIIRKTKKQIVEMIEMWAALESMAARLATLNASDADIAALRHMFDEFVHSTPAEHIEEYSDANIAFHQAIIALSGSHLMGKTLENLFIHVRAIRRMTIAQSDRATRSIADHMRIIEALEQRDTELAERLVRQHSLDLAEHVEKYCDFLD
jgi:DNA-binding GntR family transcriptional regulator